MKAGSGPAGESGGRGVGRTKPTSVYNDWERPRPLGICTYAARPGRAWLPWVRRGCAVGLPGVRRDPPVGSPMASEGHVRLVFTFFDIYEMGPQK